MQTNKFLTDVVLIAVLFAGCKSSANKDGSGDEIKTSEFVEYNNPPAEGFDVENSDAVAIMLADQVMNSMGGREKWDNTNVIYWNFFEMRTLLWDKENNRVRIDVPSQEMVIALNMNDMTGNVWKGEEKIENPDSVSKYLENGKRMWINDSYWLVMPYKLKDSGVTLKYIREDTTAAGEKADVLKLTFRDVGVTPQNAYEVWVSVDDRLVKQWAYYSDTTRQEPNFVLSWADYKDHNGILLSGKRGDRELADIKVLKKVPKGAFESPEPLTL